MHGQVKNARVEAIKVIRLNPFTQYLGLDHAALAQGRIRMSLPPTEQVPLLLTMVY